MLVAFRDYLLGTVIESLPNKSLGLLCRNSYYSLMGQLCARHFLPAKYEGGGQVVKTCTILGQPPPHPSLSLQMGADSWVVKAIMGHCALGRSTP